MSGNDMGTTTTAKKMGVVAGALFTFAGLFFAAWLSEKPVKFGSPLFLLTGVLVLASAVVGWWAIEVGSYAALRREWDESINQFSDNLGKVGLQLAASAMVHYMSSSRLQGRPELWNQIADAVEYPSNLRQWPLRLWRENMPGQTEVQSVMHRVAYSFYHIIGFTDEVNQSRRNLTRIVEKWVAWSRMGGKREQDFRALAERHITNWRPAIIALAYLEISLAESNPLNNDLASEWADIGQEWPDVFQRQVAPSEGAA
jgi:hypothetical protein